MSGGGEDMVGEASGEASEAGGEAGGEDSEADGEDPVVAIHVVDWRQAGNWSTPGDFNPDLKYPSFQLNISNGLFAKDRLNQAAQRKCGGARFQSHVPTLARPFLNLVLSRFRLILDVLWALSDSFFFGSGVVNHPQP